MKASNIYKTKLRNSKLSGLHAFDNMAIIIKFKHVKNRKVGR